NEGGASQYYSMDGKQCIYEAGGPLSGYNLYIQNGYLIFGMWNRYERKYVQYTPAVGSTEASGLYPLDPSKYYVAKLAFSGTNFTATLYANGLSPVVSTPVTFSGLTVDGSDATGIGGASRTSYHNYNTGELIFTRF
ncbi:MAG: hypothetical protein NTV98_04590, partial [Candidatus Roizmanbacteria bacterium]|nr:hypothetical protein [Candidatus Roizmanbacteria bacterium]